MIRSARGWISGILRIFASYLGYLYISFVGLTSRVRWLGEEHLGAARRGAPSPEGSLSPLPEGAARRVKGPVIFAFWHQRQVFFTWTHRGARVKILVSRSADGEIIARAMRLARIGVCRGSSSRGALEGTREMIEAAAEGLDVGFTPDGPKGPAREIKTGILYLAQKTGLPVVPITNALSRRLEFSRSWDRFQFPLPFARAVVLYGPPIFVGPQDDLEAKARELKTALDRITEEAEREVAS